MKWVLFFQTPHDRVKFMTDETYPDYTTLQYRKFCESIFKYPIKDPGKVQEHIDTFHTIFLNLETGEWHQEFPDKIDSFEELTKLNPTEDEKKEQEKMKDEREVILTKRYFDKIWDNTKRNLFKNYGNNGK